MVVVAVDAKKKYDAACAWVLATTILLKEEQRTAAVLIEEARISVAMIEPPSPTLTLAPAGRATRSDDDYEAAVITNIHVQATGMQNIHCLISVALDLSSANYARWHDNVMLTLRHYSLSDHVLLDTTYVSVSDLDRIDSLIKSWIWGTISPDQQDITEQRGHTSREALLALENHFLGNHETCALHIDATFQSFILGDLSVNDYCRKTRGFTDSLANLGVDVIDRVPELHSEHPTHVEQELRTSPCHLHARNVLPIVPEGAQRSLSGGNPIGNSEATSNCLHPHRPLHHAEASIILFFRQWAGTPTRTTTAPTTPSRTTATTVWQEEE
jgi:hypothetical protein